MTEGQRLAMQAGRGAVERGDYRQALQLLQPLSETLSPLTAAGAELQLLLATAHQGRGDQLEAARCCRAALGCADSSWRRQAQAVLDILEAPQLRRPEEWNLKLPQLGDLPPLEGAGRGWSSGARRASAEQAAPPPVGKPKAPIGFALVAITLLLGLTLLLSSCVRVDTELEFRGPGRLKLHQQVDSALAAAQRLPLATPSRVLRSTELAPLLARQVEEAAAMFGEELPGPQLTWRERNWLLGVQQRIQFDWDLSSVQPLAGLELKLHLHPLRPGAIRQASPTAAVLEAPKTILWQLQPGTINRFDLRCWRWSPLGLGSLGFGSLVLLVGLVSSQLKRVGVDGEIDPPGQQAPQL
jgi:hypothetical protein